MKPNSSSPPSVSIVMPVFNAGPCLECAVQSIRDQTCVDWELIVVDDGSTDDTVAALQRFQEQEPRLRTIRSEHRGIVSALNLGLAAARGRWIARMDADDEAHPDRLAEQSAFLNDRPEVGLVGSLVEFGGDRSRAGGYALHVDWINSLVEPEDIARNRFVESPFAHPSVMFRRELIAHGAYREGDFPEDYELWLRWMDEGVVMAKVPLVLLTWHDSSTRLSRSDPRYAVDAFYRCKSFYLARWMHCHVGEARPLFVWGAGRPTRKRAAHLLSHEIALAGYIDIDPHKIGRRLGNRPVIAPAELPRENKPFVLCYVGKRGARALARAHLARLGYREGVDFLMAA